MKFKTITFAPTRLQERNAAENIPQIDLISSTLVWETLAGISEPQVTDLEQ